MDIGRQHVIARVAGTVHAFQPPKSGLEPGFADNAKRDVLIPRGEEGRRRWIAGDTIGVAEIVKVMATAAAKRHHQRKRLAAPSSAPDPLLIVEALWWHVRLVHCPQRTDVDN